MNDLMLNSGVRSSWLTLLINRLWAAFSSTSRVMSCTVMAMPLIDSLPPKTGISHTRRARSLSLVAIIRNSPPSRSPTTNCARGKASSVRT